MNTKQRIKQLIDSVPEQKAGYVLAYIQGIVAGEDIEGNFNENVLVGNKNDEQSESKSVTSLLDKEGEYTVDDIYALPDLVHMELIDGKMYLMAPTTLTHQNYMGSISNVIYNYARSHDSISEVYLRIGAFQK
ncbi:MAG: Uma2 family endonuclease, partial [Lachnospiraceae bacterium]|nr:Uma2 family endonuclease [Lachnospiraceae bacterium]